MNSKLISEYLYSNPLVLVFIIFIPLILSLTFGNIFYNENNLGSLEDIKLPKTSESYPKELIDKEKEKISNNNVRRDLNAIEERRFNNAFVSSISSLSEIAIILGGISSSLFIGKMFSDKSIIYILVNKNSRERAFFETLALLIPYLIILGIISSLSVTVIILREFPDRSILSLFQFIFPMILYSLLLGYIFSILISTLTKNNVVPLLGVIGLVLVLPLYEHGQDILLPFRKILSNVYYNTSFDLSWSILGFSLFAFLLALIYMRFKTGDFYK